MKILDLELGSKIIIEISVRTEKLEFETTIAESDKRSYHHCSYPD